MDPLYQRSVEIILGNQSPSGAYIASPNFATYAYSWFRDGSYIAYALDLAGQGVSASHFHTWVSQIINQREAVVDRAIDLVKLSKPLGNQDILHTRYTLQGAEGTDEGWGNFQLDGFGTWLWALEQHTLLNKIQPSANWLQAARLVARYLESLWQLPNFDCWEEHPDKIHPYTLAAIYAGLEAYCRLDPSWDPATAQKIRKSILTNSQMEGHFVKYLGTPEVDANLIGLAVPYGIVSPSDPRMVATIRKIEADLVRDWGTHRYSADTYYGGGAWILLTAWLGWYFAEAGQKGKAAKCLDWIREQANAQGELPEQVPHHLNAPTFYPEWTSRWGEIATPLLWSHAFYIVLWQKMNS
jgi:GH15 family glucan-1,4-alpha-glucosidase